MDRGALLSDADAKRMATYVYEARFPTRNVAAYCGVSQSTLLRWMHGERPWPRLAAISCIAFVVRGRKKTQELKGYWDGYQDSGFWKIEV